MKERRANQRSFQLSRRYAPDYIERLLLELWLVSVAMSSSDKTWWR